MVFLLNAIAAGGASAARSDVSLLADLPPEVRESLERRTDEEPLPADSQELLDLVLRAAPAYRFETELITVYTDRRWYSTVPETGKNRPALVVRRWPGDTVAAFYTLPGTLPETAPSIVIPKAELRPDGGPSGERRWSGEVETGLGRRPIVWIERAALDAPAHLGIALLPGDGGLGEEGVESLRTELEAVAARVDYRPEAWAQARGILPGAAIDLPEFGRPPGVGDERRDPWQIASGAGFTLGLPPGIRARRTDLAVAPPRRIPGDLLWLRGRFVDRDGQLVVVGDSRRAGYLALVGERSPAWTAGHTPPLGSPQAVLVAGEPYPVVTEWTGADDARAERWREPGFEGDWLVFRIGVGEKGIEIGLPVLAGRRSLALFWIPAMWRGPGQNPAPPPIDPAKRFGIRFERLLGKDRRTRPLTEGYLWAPGLRVEIPKGWWPVANLRSTNGFPITIVDEASRSIGRLRLLEEGTGGLEAEGWSEVPRPKSHGATEVRARGDGTWVYLSADGWALLLEPLAVAPDDAGWERLARSVGLRRIRD